MVLQRTGRRPGRRSFPLAPVVAVALGLVALAGCGGSDDGAEGDRSASTTSAAASEATTTTAATSTTAEATTSTTEAGDADPDEVDDVVDGITDGMADSLRSALEDVDLPAEQVDCIVEHWVRATQVEMDDDEVAAGYVDCGSDEQVVVAAQLRARLVDAGLDDDVVTCVHDAFLGLDPDVLDDVDGNEAVLTETFRDCGVPEEMLGAA